MKNNSTKNEMNYDINNDIKNDIKYSMNNVFMKNSTAYESDKNNKDMKNGKNIIEFSPLSIATYEYPGERIISKC